MFERLSRRREDAPGVADEAGLLLSAVGNHEAKALLFLAMEPGEEYGISALHRLILAMQGGEPARRGVVNLGRKYCLHSFEPAGLVDRSVNEKGWLRHAKRDGGGRADALASHLLSVTEKHSASLSQLFGKTIAGGPHGEPGGRPPGRRLGVLRALAHGPTETNATELAHRVGAPEFSVGQACRKWAAAGLVSYSSAATYKMKSTYAVTQPVGHNPHPRARMQRAVADFLNSRLQGCGSGVVVTRDEIEEHLRVDPRWREAAGLRDLLQRIMLRMLEVGDVRDVANYSGPTHTVVAVDPVQRAFLGELVDGIDLILEGDRPVMESSRAAGERIVADPERVRHLMAKAFAASKQASNPITRAEKQRRVLALLDGTTGTPTEEIVIALAPDLNKPLVASTLNELVAAGEVWGERAPGGPSKLWFRAR